MPRRKFRKRGLRRWDAPVLRNELAIDAFLSNEIERLSCETSDNQRTN